jgi:hypothetical protein
VKLPNTLRKTISGPYFGSYYQFVNGTNTIMPRVRLPLGDINNDNQLDILDYNLLMSAYGTKQGDPKYNPAADLIALASIGFQTRLE